MSEKKQYTLTWTDGKPYLSDEKGTLGGNKLDCTMNCVREKHTGG